MGSLSTEWMFCAIQAKFRQDLPMCLVQAHCSSVCMHCFIHVACLMLHLWYVLALCPYNCLPVCFVVFAFSGLTLMCMPQSFFSRLSKFSLNLILSCFICLVCGIIHLNSFCFEWLLTQELSVCAFFCCCSFTWCIFALFMSAFSNSKS